MRAVNRSDDVRSTANNSRDIHGDALAEYRQ